MSVLWLVHGLLEMKDRCVTVFPEEAFALGNRRDVRWADCASSIMPASKHALHPYLLSNYNTLRLDPLEVPGAAFPEKRLELGY